jgi:manganese/zinc/iron transport system permease protein
MLAAHLLHHEGRPEATEETRLATLSEHLRWAPGFVDAVVRRAEQAQLVRREDGQLRLTERGRALAAEAMVR